MKHIFGPVNSRRFGLSLGVDLSFATKQCNFDCVYCELEPKKATKEQVDISSPTEIIDEIKTALQKHKKVDVLTLTANGEPTMYPHLQELITAINSFKGTTKTLILSNASKINDEETQEILCDIDIVKLSLDAVDEQVFKKIDRQHSSVELENIKQGMLVFREKFKGEFVIEILFVKGINDKPEHIKQLNEFCQRLRPHRIDISTIDRPPAYQVQALQNDELFALASFFDESLPLSVAYKKRDTTPVDFSEEEILGTIKRRPQNEEDTQNLFSPTAQKNLQNLLHLGKIKKQKRGEDTFFVLN